MEQIRAVPDNSRGDDRLDSWKRIAAYLKRGVRTVRRWEAEERLPVHRHAHQKQGSVYAYKSEVDTWLDTRSQVTRKTKQIPMLAVLPFDNLSGDPDKEFFVDGFTEELISQLGSVQRDYLGVIARTSIMTYKGVKKTVTEIGKELNVQYVLEGSLRIDKLVVRVTAQLIRVQDQTHIWAENYERSMKELLVMQCALAGEAAAEILAVLKVPLADKAILGSAPKTKMSADVYETYLKARFLLYRLTGDSLTNSVACFQQVIDANPDFAPAYAGQAEALQLMTLFSGAAASTTMPRSLEAASRAVALDPNSGEAFAALGFVHSTYTWDWQASESAFLRAIELAPNLAIAYQWYAEMLSMIDRCAEAYRLVERARELDPMSLAIACSYGHVLQMDRRPEKLVRAMARVIEMEPRFPLAHIFYGAGYAELEQYDQAEAAFVQAELNCGALDVFASFRGYIAGRCGQMQAAEVQHQRLRDIAKENHVTPFMHAIIYIGMGQFETAMDCLEAAIEERSWHLTMLNTVFLFDPLKSFSRFDVLLSRVNFPTTK